ncbi:response regulator [Rickettsiella endosymbiont of Aleochara curtula]|uniref:response regulator n=1 Tax=Rickettsiella endosymbiont of Aleochara curtula TaxID=3077936 RepID=UPI00313BBE06
MEHQEKQLQETSVTIGKRALLVEDYIPCQKIMTHYLKQLGYEVELADNGITAVEQIQSKVYDLIVEDLGLSGVTGKEVIKKVRESPLNVGTPLLVWSAYVNRYDEEKYLAWGADGVLIKVCQVKELKKAIDKCFSKSRYHRKFHYQLQNFKKKCDQFFDEAQALKDSECVNQFKFSLHEALATIEEHQHWLNLNKNEKHVG